MKKSNNLSRRNPVYGGHVEEGLDKVGLGRRADEKEEGQAIVKEEDSLSVNGLSGEAAKGGHNDGTLRSGPPVLVGEHMQCVELRDCDHVGHINGKRPEH